MCLRNFFHFFAKKSQCLIGVSLNRVRFRTGSSGVVKDFALIEFSTHEKFRSDFCGTQKERVEVTAALFFA